MTSSRLIATEVIESVLNGTSLKEALEKPIIKKHNEKPLIQAMCYGVCRDYPTLDMLLSLLLTRPIKNKDKDIHVLLILGLYQLRAMNFPHHAAVTETVNVAEGLKKSWAKGLVNATLRNFLRRKDFFETEILKSDMSSFAHPEWFIDMIKKDWPSDWGHILEANNQHPPFSCRTNALITTREEYIHQLPATMQTTIIPYTTSGLAFDTPLSIDDVPGFSSGTISVQDGAAQLAAALLELKSGQCVLDACAAPGGKLTHILELQPKLKKIVAVEKEKQRLHLIQENLERLNLQATCVLADAAETSAWWDMVCFDRILLDAPCSASGVIRRHPDIKLLRKEEDVLQLQTEQLRLLNTLWPLLALDGILLYCTCSVFHAENQDVIKKFLSTRDDAEEIVIEAEWGMPMLHGRQILSGTNNMDGFYFAKLRKR